MVFYRQCPLTLMSAESALLPLAKCRSRFIEVIDEKTFEIQRFNFNEASLEYESEFDPVSARLESFAVQAAARDVLKTIVKKSISGDVPRYRVCHCLRSRLSGVDDVSIVKSATVDSVRYSGLQTCGSVWHCKICATRISEVRKLQVRSAVDSWLGQGKGVIFLTNTFPHGRDDDLRLMLLKLFDVAWHRYINHPAYKRVLTPCERTKPLYRGY